MKSAIPEHSEQPTCVLFAGPNGSGKSTVYTRFLDAGYDAGEYLNPDDIARALGGSTGQRADLAAGREVIARTRSLIAAHSSFVRETTLTSHEVLRMIEAAKNADYRVVMVFVAVSSSDLSRGRVSVRVASGGHDIPADAQRRRFPKALRNAARAAAVADAAYLLDNSGMVHRLVASVRHGTVTFFDPQGADWLDQATAGLPLAPTLKSREDALAELRERERLSAKLEVREPEVAYRVDDAA